MIRRSVLVALFFGISELGIWGQVPDSSVSSFWGIQLNVGMPDGITVASFVQLPPSLKVGVGIGTQPLSMALLLSAIGCSVAPCNDEEEAAAWRYWAVYSLWRLPSVVGFVEWQLSRNVSIGVRAVQWLSIKSTEIVFQRRWLTATLGYQWPITERVNGVAYIGLAYGDPRPQLAVHYLTYGISFRWMMD